MPGPNDVQFDEFGDEDTDECPECGAPAGEPCDPGCPSAEEETVDPDSAYDARAARGPFMPEGVSGDKFMDRIIMEETRRGMPVMNDSPLRKNAARYQERPLGKTRVGSK